MSSAEPVPRASPVRRLLTIASACAGAGTLATLVHSRSGAGFDWVNHDVAFNLYTGRLAFLGQRIYVDRVDTNPPAILLVSGLVDRLADLLHASPVSLFHGFVILVGVLGLWCIHRTYDDARMPSLSLVSLAYLVVLAGAGLPGDPGFTYSFGQKEHLFALVFVPYVVASLTRAMRGRAFSVLLVVLGVFSQLKPQLFALVVLVEAIAVVRKRPDWHVLALLASGALLPYAGLLALSFESFKAFLPQMLRLHFGGAYAYFDQPFSTFVASAAHGWVLSYALLLACVLWACGRQGVLSRRLVAVLAAVPVAAYLLVVQQHKFWDYQSIVLASALLVALAHAAGALLDAADARARWMLQLLVAILVVHVLAAEVQLYRMVARWKESASTEPGASLLQAAPLLRDRPRTLYYSTSNVYARLPLFLNQRVVGRWGHEVLFPSIVREPSGKVRSQKIDAYCAEQRDLIERERPDAIVFYSTGQALTSPEQDLHSVLVGRCNVIPAGRYGPALAPAPRTVLFLRSDGATNPRGVR